MGLRTIIFKEEMSRYVYNMTAGIFGRILLISAMIGLFAWSLSFALNRYMIEPFFCNNEASVSICMNSAVISANIATVLMGIMIIPLLATLRVKRSLIVAIAGVISLWGVSGWIAGQWYVSLLWTIIAYVVVYAALTWINRLRGSAAAIVFMLLFALLARLVIML